MYKFSLMFLLAGSLVFAGEFHHRRDVEACDIQGNDAADDACSMKQAFAGSSIFPQLLSTFSPQGALYVQYRNIVVGGAQQLAPFRVTTKPNLSIDFIKGVKTPTGAQMLSKKYAVLCVDYQPKGQTSKTVWLQSGMKVDQNTGAMIPSIAPIFQYRSPNPPAGTGIHEYVFLVFEESGAGLSGLLQRQPQLKASLSGAFNLKTFLAKNNLGNSLIAGSFFKSTHV